ncbi:dihydrolipoamide acetyltransferase family protein [Pseudomonas oryzihabitans]|uniref:Dihydrolipoamide acetyltransferase component of pyruvate dehydrogenase complex n=1 Tax=Pseudomonas oryzihabitans TaxID=47885 RepID=A0ABX3IRT0_9PSED|nr:2-oxo acid dehydrogenase subunit E2 [Pseudomonas psychrotolerans]ONN71060.1 dihydrolipoamide succinyltransferase [Pseudomonas psychrotolerans]
MNDMTIKQPAQEIIAPLEQEGTKAVLRSWLKQSGATVVKDEPIVELETDKVVVEVCAPCDGTLEVLMSEGSDAEPGAVLGLVGQAAEQVLDASPQPSTRPLVAAAAEGAEARFDPELRLSPAVRRLLTEHQLDPTQLEGCGTGRGGRLTREDVVAAIAEREQFKERPPKASPVAEPQPVQASAAKAPEPLLRTPSASGANGARVAAHVPHSSMRRKIAEHMQHSVSTAPHVTAVFSMDFAAITAHRQKHKPVFAEQGVNLTFTAYFVAAAVQAMQAAPEVNSRWHADYLELFKDVNIGIGAALGDKGLIVPVIHRAQELSLLGIAARLQEVTEAARNGKLKPGDVTGGTFTISNHGVSGSLFASPIIINQPQSAILGIGALAKRVVVREIDGVDTFQVRQHAYVSLTIDHRVLDGSQTNAWLSRFVEVIEGWSLES